ncbi:MAG: DUF885 domain-containing protein [Candidatus Hodarchaeales archaeon]|jgi:uncharacterized protein (DUF885 family)
MSEDERFIERYNNFFDEYLKENPIYATYLGKHDQDHLLGDSSKEHVIKVYELLMIAWKEMEEAIDKSKLSFENQIDYELLEHSVELQKFRFEILQTWKTGYGWSRSVGAVGSALYALLTREFAPFEKRAESMVGRMERVPEFLDQSKNTWIEPVELWTRLTIQECETTPSLLQFLSALISQYPGISDELKERAAKAAKMAMDSISTYKTFLEQDVLPRADRDWCIGEENLSKILELRKLPYKAEEILEMGWRFFNETNADLEKLASDMAPGKTFEEVREMIKSDHPETFDELLEFYTKSVTEARKYVIEKELASVPEKGEVVEVKETPEYMAPIIPFAAYMTPAYFDEEKIGIYIVTRPKDPSMFQEHSYNGILNTSVHEAYPGHHLQMSMGVLNTSFIRIFAQGTETVEGWAHYCELMMLEEGFLQGKEFEFIQKLDVLWRAARIIIDVKLSSGKMTFDEAVNLLVEKVGMKKEGATAEVKRYTSSPGYQLSYLIGKHLILDLREKMKEKLGDKFNLKFFHDVILKNGGIPYYFLEQVMEREADKLLAN